MELTIEQKVDDLNVPKGYQLTEAGVIPNDWVVKSISQLCKLINGRGFKPHEWKDTGLPIIRIQNLNGSDDYNYFEGIYNPKILIENGQLLFAWSGSRGTSFGPHIWKGKTALLNYHTWKVVVNEKEVDHDFFLHVLKHLTKYIEDKAHGASALVHTQKGEMEAFQIPLPRTLVEQEKISSFLSDADALINNLEALIVKKRAIKQGALKEIYSRNEGWVAKRLGDLLDYEQPTKYLVQSTEYNDNNKTPVLTAGKTFVLGYTDEEFGIYTNLPVIIFDDFTTASKYVTFPFKAKSSAMKMLSLKDKRHNLKFLHEMMQQIDFPLGDHKRHWIGEYQEIEVRVPEKGEQDKIAEIFSDMDNEIETLEQKLEKFKMLKQGMMQELITGKTRLI